MAALDDEERLLRSVALQNANSIRLARLRAEEELIRTKDALRESQERLQAALAAAGTGTFRWNLQTNAVEWDGNLDRLFGLVHGPAAQTIAAFTSAVHAEDRPGVSAHLEQCARDGSDFDMEFRVVWPDSSVHWIDSKAKAFVDDDGTPLYITGACADVTSRKDAAEALRENEQRLRAIFNQAAVGIAVATLDGHFVRVNKKFSDIMGYSPDQLRDLTLSAITHPDDLADTLAAVRRLLNGSHSEYALEKRYLRRDGFVVWSLTTVTLLKDAAGQPERFIGVIEDITLRKQAESALREESRILEILNETGQRLASKLDLHAVLQAVTNAATQLSGALCGAFFYNTMVEEGDTDLFDTFSGAAQDAFARVVNPRALALFDLTFRGDATIRCDDVVTDTRYGTMAAPLQRVEGGDVPVRSYLAVPVRSRSGKVIGGLFFGHSQPGVFSERAERLAIGVAAQAGIAIDNARLYEAAQKAADERKILLESERAGPHRRRKDERRQGRVPGHALPRAAHAAQRHPRLGAGAAQRLRAIGADLTKGLEAIERNARVQTQLIEDLLDMSRIISGKLRLDVQPLDRRCRSSKLPWRPSSPPPTPRASGSRALLDPAAGPDLRRSRPAPASRLEPALQRHQVHAKGRQGPGPARARELAHRDQRGGHGCRHHAGVPAPSLRALPAGRCVDDAHATAGSGWGCRSSRAWSSCTAARSRPGARAKAKARPLRCICR